MRRAILLLGIGSFVLGSSQLAACGDDSSQFDGSADGSIGDGNSGDSPLFNKDGADPGDSSACDPSDMLVVLDHTDSMSNLPNGGNAANTDAGHAQTKWVLACDAVKAVTTPPADQTLRFGLELFPLDPAVITDAGGTGKCETLTALIGGTASTNKQCMPGEVLVSPSLNTGTQIATILDPETLKLCVSTPIAAALTTAKMALSQIAVSGRKQFVILVTDGGETCVGDNAVVSVAQAMAASGVNTYIVGFGAADAGAAGVNVPLLNNLACAGMTAKNFSTTCTKQDGGGYVATTANGPPLFFAAEDGASLQTALSSVTSGLCCGCVH